MPRTFEVGVSDCHHLLLTSMRSQYIWGNPEIKLYWDYKRFSFEQFDNEWNKVKAEKDIDYSSFKNS